MGQVNLPILNRAGFFSFWDSVWEDFFNYQRAFREDIFAKKLLSFLLFDQILFSNFFLSLNYFFLIKKISRPFFINYKNYTELTKFFKKQAVKTSPIYFSKLWVIKFQKWVLLSIYLYKPLIKATETDNDYDEVAFFLNNYKSFINSFNEKSQKHLYTNYKNLF